MQHVGMALLTVITLVFQTSLTEELSHGGFEPDFVAAALLASVFLRSGNGAVVWAGLIGLSADCFSPAPLGLRMVAALTIVAGVRWVWREPCRISVRFSAFATLAVCCGWVLVPWALTSFSFQELDPTGALAALRRAASSVLLAAGLLLLVRAVSVQMRHWRAALHGNRWAMLR